MKPAAAPAKPVAKKPAAKMPAGKGAVQPRELGPVARDILEKAARIRKALNGKKL